MPGAVSQAGYFNLGRRMSSSEELKVCAATAYRAGCSITYIASDLGIPKDQVRAILVAAAIPIRKRGFAAMSIEQRRAIATKGGASVPSDRRAYSQDRHLASEAGRSGGISLHHGSGAASHPRVSRQSARFVSSKEES